MNHNPEPEEYDRHWSDYDDECSQHGRAALAGWCIAAVFAIAFTAWVLA